MGLPSSIEDKDLEPTACRVLQHIAGGITGKGIEVCHRLNKQCDRTIAKFLRRKDCERVMRKKSELRKLKPSKLDLPNGKKLYINESLCPYRGLWNKCKKLWKKQRIFSFFTVNGSIRIKIRENGPYNIITHIDDLKDISPDEDSTMSYLVTCFLFEAAVRRSSVRSCSCGFLAYKRAVLLAFFSGIDIFRQLLGLRSATE